MQFRQATIVIFLGAGLNPPSALSSEIIDWNPASVGILNQFGTTTQVADDFSTCCPFAGFNAVAESFAETPLPGQPPLNADIFAAARATATVGEFSVGARTVNQTGGDAPSRDISALAAATTNYFIPAHGLNPEFLIMNLLVEGSFDNDVEGSFVEFDILVNDTLALVVTIFDDSRGSFTQLTNSFGDFNLGPWTGSQDFLFALPADPDEDTFGTLALQLWMFSLPAADDRSTRNAADFLSTATVTAEPPPGGFVGFATGQAFVPDDAVAVPAPGSLALFVLGLVGLAPLAPRRTARP